ncbi:Chromo domain-containing protein, partial [Aphis craccivora]
STYIGTRKNINRKIKLNIDNVVHILVQIKGVAIYTKGYLPSLFTEIFIIIKINQTMPFTYQLSRYKIIQAGKPVAGSFYLEEIYR